MQLQEKIKTAITERFVQYQDTTILFPHGACNVNIKQNTVDCRLYIPTDEFAEKVASTKAFHALLEKNIKTTLQDKFTIKSDGDGLVVETNFQFDKEDPDLIDWQISPLVDRLILGQRAIKTTLTEYMNNQ